MESVRPRIATLPRGLSAARRVPRPLYRCLNTSPLLSAQPVNLRANPGPPPPPPTPTSDALERVARKRRQADMLKKAQEARASPSRPKTMLQKRFWQDVTVQETDDGLQVFLDKRPVRTPEKDILTTPASKPQLATAIALEWDLLVSAQQALQMHYIPMTSLSARANDILRADAEGKNKLRAEINRMLMRYFDTDTLMCWAPEKNIHDAPQDTASLRDLQIKLSKPIVTYLTTRVWPGVEIHPVLEEGKLMPIPQPEHTKTVIRGWVAALPGFELAGLERAVLASKSFLLGARFVHEWSEEFAHTREITDAARFGIDEAAEAASVEVSWQTTQWGEVDDTHDVEKEDLKRQLGSVVLLVGGLRA